MYYTTTLYTELEVYCKLILFLLAQYTESGKGILGSGIELTGLFDNIKINITSYENIINDFKKISDFSKYWEKDKFNWDAIAKAIEGCDETALSYFKTLEDGNGTINNQSASTEGLSTYLKKSGQMFNFAAVKATLLNTALNAGIFLVASVAIQGMAKALNSYIHKVEKARERTDELFSEFRQMNDTLADHKKTVSAFADRYDELSKGVNLSTNSNVSLSTEEYEEFLDINEQLAASFPELAKGIDKNGNSILALGTSGVTAKEQLMELLQTEENLNNFRVAQGLEDAFKGVYTYVEEANEAAGKLNRTVSDSSEVMGQLQEVAENGIKLTGENGQLIFTGNINEQADREYMNSLTASVHEFWKSLDGSRRVELDTLGINDSNLFNFVQNDEYTGAFAVYSQAYSLTPEELTTLENIIQDNVGHINGALLDSISEQAQELHEQVQKGENAWKDFIPNLISGMKSKQTFKDLDPDLQDIAIRIVEGLDYSYASAMKAYDPDPYAYIRDKFIVPMGDLNDSDRQKLQTNFERLLKLDALDISDSNRTEISRLVTAIADILEKDPAEIRVALGFDVGDDTKKRLQNSIRQISDDHGISDRDQYSDLAEYTKDFTVAQAELWLEATKDAENATQAIEMYETKLAEAKNLANEPSTLLSIPDTITHLNTNLKPAFDSLHAAYQNIFTDDGALDRSSIDILSTCDSIKSKLDEMSELGLKVDYSSFENFVKVLNNTETTEQDMQTTFDSLATSITDAALSGAEDFETMKAALEDLGVVNNEMVAFDALIRNTEVLKEAGLDLSEATYDDIEAFTDGIISAENYGQAVNLLKIQKILCAENPLDTSGDIMNLYLLANAAGIATDSILQLMRLNADYTKASAEGNTAASLVALGQMEVVKQKIQNQFAHLGDNVDFTTIGGGTSAAGSAGRSAGRSYRDALKEELGDLNSIISGVTRSIDDQISSVNEQKSTALDALDAEKNALEETKDAAVEALEAERDARLEVIEAQKEQLEEQVSLIDRQIEQKQKEIDAINDAADARQREIDLQKAQYELERMQNQHTILQYSEAEGMHYVQDTSGIRDAKEQADEAKRQIEIAGIEKEIDLLEKNI